MPAPAESICTVNNQGLMSALCDVMEYVVMQPASVLDVSTTLLDFSEELERVTIYPWMYLDTCSARGT